MDNDPHARFEAKLARLKEVLNVEADQDAAAALGMSKWAFSSRKARGSFPDDLVVQLQRSRPDLNVLYVLFGAGSLSSAATMSEDELRAWVRRYERLMESSVDSLYADAIKHPRVQTLLRLLMGCSDQSLELVIKLVEKVRAADAKDGVLTQLFTHRPSFSYLAKQTDQVDVQIERPAQPGEVAGEAPPEPPAGPATATPRRGARRAKRGG